MGLTRTFFLQENAALCDNDGNIAVDVALTFFVEEGDRDVGVLDAVLKRHPEDAPGFLWLCVVNDQLTKRRERAQSKLEGPCDGSRQARGSSSSADAKPDERRPHAPPEVEEPTLVLVLLRIPALELSPPRGQVALGGHVGGLVAHGLGLVPLAGPRAALLGLVRHDGGLLRGGRVASRSWGRGVLVLSQWRQAEAREGTGRRILK